MVNNVHSYLFLDPNIDTSSKFRIHWQSRDLTATEECAVQIPYEGTPFIYIGEKAYMCHLGRNKATKSKEAKETMEPSEVRNIFVFMVLSNNLVIGDLFYSLTTHFKGVQLGK